MVTVVVSSVTNVVTISVCVVCLHIISLQHHQQSPSFASAFQVKLFPLESLMVATEYVTMMPVCGTFDPF